MPQASTLPFECGGDQSPAKARTRPRSTYVVIEGPIGVGKTTLVQRLAARLQCRTVYEVFEENPFLSDFYADQARYAFQTEMFFLLSRFRQQEAFAQPDLFSPYAVSDYLFEKSRLFARLTLNDDEFALFDHVYQVLSRNIPVPDLVIYLRAPLPTLLQRIRQRGRSYEQDMDPEYLSNLSGVYDRYFARQDDIPLLIVDAAAYDFSTDDAAVDQILCTIHRPPRGRAYLGDFRTPPF